MAVITFGPAATPDEAETINSDMFIPINTSRLMGVAEPHEIFGVENAFPELTFKRPVVLTHAGDRSDRIFVAEQDGKIHVWPNDPRATDVQLFLDLSPDVRREHNEEGLLEFSRPYGNHNGGSLNFGPDGFLYISVGDGGLGDDPHEHGQNQQTLFGSILRIDVDQKDVDKNYSIPRDNPFVELAGKARGEIWAFGLRNPWRMAFDRLTGTLWASDVGQERSEEVNIIVKGGNYGWNLREGKQPRDPFAVRDSARHFIDPVFDYPRVEGKSITGGLVYRGKRLPALQGAYVYADFMSGNIWALHWDGHKATANYKVARSSLLISSFGEDESGELYFTAFDGGIHRFRTPEKNSSRDFPTTLTETGLFKSVKDHQPATGLIAYDVNVPLWSDGAAKERFIALPHDGSIAFDDKEQWGFPVGTVFVKTFFLQTDTTNLQKRRRLETRLWLQNSRGWDGYTYLWNDEQTEATLLADWPFRQQYEIKTPEGYVNQEWYFPSRSDCHACHTHNAGFVLGWNTRQLNRLKAAGTGNGAENQIEKFKRLKLFTSLPLPPTNELEAYPDWADQNAPVETRARAYLDVNCAVCHSPGGFGTAGGSKANLNFHVRLDTAFAVPNEPNPNALQWIVPGESHYSQLLKRMSSRNPKVQMPPLATLRPDHDAQKVICQWIDALKNHESQQ